MSDLYQSPITGRRYGCLPDLPDTRDVVYKLDHTNMQIPSEWNLGGMLGPVRDQGNEGSCAGQSGAGLLDFLYRQYYAYEKDKTVKPGEFKSSAQFIYNRALALDGDTSKDNGTYPRTIMQVLNRQGACLELVEPYIAGEFSKAPTQAQIDNALKYKAGAYHRLTSIYQMKSCIASNYAFLAGMMVYASFESQEVADTGEVPIPDTSREELLGGHATLYYGYNDDYVFKSGLRGAFFVRNSWGEDWGVNGNFIMPYDFASYFVSDAWMIHLGLAWK